MKDYTEILADALAAADLTLTDINPVKFKDMGMLTGFFCFHVDAKIGNGNPNPNPDNFYKLKPRGGFRGAKGPPFNIKLAQELLAKYNVCLGCHRFLAYSKYLRAVHLRDPAHQRLRVPQAWTQRRAGRRGRAPREASAPLSSTNLTV